MMKGDSKLSEYRLEMHNVVKTFPGVRALDGAQLNLRPGPRSHGRERRWKIHPHEMHVWNLPHG